MDFSKIQLLYFFLSKRNEYIYCYVKLLIFLILLVTDASRSRGIYDREERKMEEKKMPNNIDSIAKELFQNLADREASTINGGDSQSSNCQGNYCYYYRSGSNGEYYRNRYYRSNFDWGSGD